MVELPLCQEVSLSGAWDLKRCRMDRVQNCMDALRSSGCKANGETTSALSRPAAATGQPLASLA
jgi:hypothetical protein